MCEGKKDHDQAHGETVGDSEALGEPDPYIAGFFVDVGQGYHA